MKKKQIFSLETIKDIKSIFKNKNKQVIWVFIFTLYSLLTFELFNRPFGQVTNLKIPFDDKIPMVKELIVVYHTFAFMIIFVGLLLLVESDKEYRKFIWSLFLSQSLAYIIYINFQTFVPRYDTSLLGDDIFSNLVRLTYSVDNSYSGAPSLHVANMTLSIIYLGKTSYKNSHKIGLIIYLALVALTTVLVKQHVVLDIPAGLIHALLVYFIIEYIFKKKNI